jgi:hypothetical protein
MLGVLTPEEHLAKIAADARVAATPVDPPHIKIVHTPLDGQSKPASREKTKMAVGSESIDFPEHSLANMGKRPLRQIGSEEETGDPLAILRERNHAW